MSFSDAFFQTSVTALPFTQVLTGMVQLTLLAGVLMFFRPLLVGIARALMLAVRPRPTKDELAARRKLRNAKLAQATPAANDSDAGSADIRAMGSRS
ncbi:hypothetical protein [Massilia sp. TN1-12]|uniref:hypothetical protein n=1 Tax=Massilia paldalensis TaxID=3377675 RepID=UPI00384A5980